MKEEGVEFALTDKVGALERDLRATQEMLAFVLYQTGTVEVPKSLLAEGLPETATITVNDDLQRNVFVFGLEMGEE